MMLGNKAILGLSIDEYGILAAEISFHAGRADIHRMGRMSFPNKLSQENVKDLGGNLKQFLKTNHFTSRQVIVGIPTKWIVTREIVAPPAPSDAMSGLLGIQAERAFSLGSNELVFDYLGQTSTSEKSRVMLIAARRQIIEQIKELTESAGLHVRSVTVSVLAFDKDSAKDNIQHNYSLYVRPQYCEFWSRSNGSLRAIKHVPIQNTNGTKTEWPEILTSTLERLILLSSEQNLPASCNVKLYDTGNITDSEIDGINSRLQPRIAIKKGNTQLLGNGLNLSNHPDGVQSFTAAAVAMTGAGTEAPPVDFLNPRIGRKKTTYSKRIIVWAASAAAVFILAIGAVIIDWQIKRSDIASCTARLAQISDQVTAAKELVDRLSYAGSWTSQKPRFLECVRQLTLAFPESPQVWTTSIGLSEGAECSITGKAIDEKSFYEVLDNIKKNSAFSEVMLMHLRDAGSNSSEKEFAVTFKFQGLK